jgi:hypothetical protein
MPYTKPSEVAWCFGLLLAVIAPMPDPPAREAVDSDGAARQRHWQRAGTPLSGQRASRGAVSAQRPATSGNRRRSPSTTAPSCRGPPESQARPGLPGSSPGCREPRLASPLTANLRFGLSITSELNSEIKRITSITKLDALRERLWVTLLPRLTRNFALTFGPKLPNPWRPGERTSSSQRTTQVCFEDAF